MSRAFAIPSPPSAWASFQVGPLTVHTYALCILAGIVGAVLVTARRLPPRGIARGVAVDLALWAVPAGIVGARIYHVLTHGTDYFGPGRNLANVVAIWDGGNAIYGGLMGGTIGAVVGSRRARVPLGALADALAPALLVAQAVGRLGNWFNHELFGLPTTLPWGLQIEATNRAYPSGAAPGLLFHPLFLYEILWNLAGVAVLLLLERRRRLAGGRMFALYLVWYGLGRAWFEAIRIDPTSDRFLGVPANDWTSFLTVAVGVVLFVLLTRRQAGVDADGTDAEPSADLDAHSSADVPSGEPDHGSGSAVRQATSGS